jgi:hypothetical protein
MADLASGSGAMVHQMQRGIAMATQAEIMKARFAPDLNPGRSAPMASDARPLPAPIHEVVMTLNAVHRTVFFVGKIQRQRYAARHQRLAQLQRRSGVHQREQYAQRE